MSDLATQGVDIQVSFDTTGSMYPCLPEVRRRLAEAIERLKKDIPDLRIGIVAHGDYCDEGKTYVTQHLPMTDDVDRLVSFVKQVAPTYGGDSPECYEFVLHEVRKIPLWRPDAKKILILIGDDVPHEKNYHANLLRLDWREEARLLANAGVTIYPIQALGRRSATAFYESLAQMGGGTKLELDQFNQAIETIVAVCLKQVGNEQLQQYANELSSAKLMNRSIAKMISALLGTDVASISADYSPGTKDLEAVHPSRFQILNVDKKTVIKSFVEETGAHYETGKGYYQLVKKETVQPYKRVVLRDKKTGDMFGGQKARHMLGLPDTRTVDIKPSKELDEKYTVFVESTSYNRKLDAGTQFLYEVKDFEG